jgi:hypothetical protein
MQQTFKSNDNFPLAKEWLAHKVSLLFNKLLAIPFQLALFTILQLTDLFTTIIGVANDTIQEGNPFVKPLIDNSIDFLNIKLMLIIMIFLSYIINLNDEKSSKLFLKSLMIVNIFYIFGVCYNIFIILVF